MPMNEKHKLTAMITKSPRAALETWVISLVVQASLLSSQLDSENCCG